MEVIRIFFFPSFLRGSPGITWVRLAALCVPLPRDAVTLLNLSFVGQEWKEHLSRGRYSVPPPVPSLWTPAEAQLFPQGSWSLPATGPIMASCSPPPEKSRLDVSSCSLQLRGKRSNSLWTDVSSGTHDEKPKLLLTQPPLYILTYVAATLQLVSKIHCIITVTRSVTYFTVQCCSRWMGSSNRHVKVTHCAE